MFQKFIINRDGVLKFGHVYLHRDMLAPGEQCTYGGGLWKIDEGRGAIVLYGIHDQVYGFSRAALCQDLDLSE